MTVRASVLWSPKWVIAHVLALVLIVLFVNLGLWQLGRLDEARAHNAVLEQRLAAEPLDIADVFDADADTLAYRRVQARGHYLAGETVLTAPRGTGGSDPRHPRARDGVPGNNVVVPLAIDSRGVLVNRGWVPVVEAGVPPPEAAPPEGDVTITGVLVPSEEPFTLGPSLAAEGRLEMVTRIDVARLQAQVSVELLPLYLLAASEEPPGGQLPLPVALPAPSEGNHLSYAIQWFLFAAVGVIGYPILLRTVARSTDRIATATPAQTPR